ncbi:HNH endonuclease [Streptomyces sp. NPDC004267]|uniref:HNH endonuclease n=1 Tax=Streptomyces sp. NPDC004267 TaxID=3364694 RepID=UPI0036B7AB3E
MAEGRPDIPTELKRSVLVEAGHRCAIPTCRQTPVELAHITPWTKAREHTFPNLIALCPTCHTRFDRKEIDRKSMLQYKENLGILNSRYTDVERQVLKVYAKMWAPTERAHSDNGSLLEIFREAMGENGSTFGFGDISVSNGMWWLLSNLIDDEIVVITPYYPEVEGAPAGGVVALTGKGLALIRRIVAAEPL